MIGAAQDLVGLGDWPFHSSRVWPLSRSLSIHGIRLPASGTPKFSVGKARIAQRPRDFPVDIEDRRGRIVQQVFRDPVGFTHLLQQLAHVLGAGAGSGLVGHGADPLHQSCLEQSAHRHQHQAHGAVAADVVLYASASACSMTWRLTGSRMMTASFSIRSVEAASIQ